MVTRVVLQGYILVPEEDLEVVKTALPEHIRLTKAEKGCLDFQLTQSITNPRRFDVYEIFSNQAAFAEHQARVKTSAWGEISRHVERHYQVSEKSEW